MTLFFLIILAIIIYYTLLYGKNHKNILKVDESKKCPNCGNPVEKNFNVCPICKETLKKKCTDCGESVDASWKYCPYCEANLRKGEEK